MFKYLIISLLIANSGCVTINISYIPKTNGNPMKYNIKDSLRYNVDSTYNFRLPKNHFFRFNM